MTIDAHLHLWDLEHGVYGWLSDAVAPINRTFRLADAEPHLDAARVEQAILVQAADAEADTRAMFAVDAGSPRVAGVVAWADLLNPDGLGATLDEYAASGPLVGLRHLIHDEPDPEWLAQRAVHESLAQLAARDLAFDVIGVLPRHLVHALVLADELPGLQLVVDHLGSPPVGAGANEVSIWRELILELAERPNVAVKLSGLTTLGPSGRASADDLRPFSDTVLGAFGPGRVLFGGDWPVSTLATTYAETMGFTLALLSGVDADGTREVLGGTARRVYRLP
ncbi:amidohydrolase family protein [Leifsonia shinshuensis]|uniref:amidohydrolase family protein n=1 Tax=Leifsonia shinshuensis TaxID=150026 RepID=UPI002858BD92|nr:amidohydrolase family protein [Leifsonia shinshuensis]MDR6971975.1 L-fuconolactonase [Leifsonia shinshuensis]